MSSEEKYTMNLVQVALTKKCFPPRRASPDGQSFRSLGEETPADFRRKRDKRSEDGDSDDDYENVREPDVTQSIACQTQCA